MSLICSFKEFAEALDAVIDRPPVKWAHLVSSAATFQTRLQGVEEPDLLRRAIRRHWRREALKTRLAVYEREDRYYYWTEELWRPLCLLGTMEAHRMRDDLHRIGYYLDAPALDPPTGDTIAFCDVSRFARQLGEADRMLIAQCFMPPMKLPSRHVLVQDLQPTLDDLIRVARRLRMAMNAEVVP